MIKIRDYRPSDESGWLECRVLSFLGSNYYDDVRISREGITAPYLSLVAESEGKVVGLIDIELDGGLATIDSIAVHPSAQQRGMASALLDNAVKALPSQIRTLDAWTREDVAANRWYRRNGFVQTYRYLHVYKDPDEPRDGFQTPEGLSSPVMAFMHADIEHEAKMRAAFRRVYVCRRYELALSGA